MDLRELHIKSQTAKLHFSARLIYLYVSITVNYISFAWKEMMNDASRPFFLPPFLRPLLVYPPVRGSDEFLMVRDVFLSSLPRSPTLLVTLFYDLYNFI